MKKATSPIKTKPTDTKTSFSSQLDPNISRAFRAVETLPSQPLQLDPNRLIRLKQVLQIVPVSPSCWWNWVKEKRAPVRYRHGW